MARILHLLDTLGVGGAENMVANLARWQAEHGCEVHVHGMMDGGPIATRLDSLGIPATWIETTHYAPAMWALCRLIRHFRPDVIHCHNILPTLLGTVPAKLFGRSRLFATRHGTRWKNDAVERRFWFFARWHRNVIAVSDSAYREFSACRFADVSKLVLIPNAAAPPDATPPAVDPPHPGFTVVSVGRLVEYKDYGNLLEALALALGEDAGLYLWLVGDGVERAGLEQRVRELHLDRQVAFLGARSNVGWWLQQADLFVLSSWTEGLPISLLEAFAMGRAAVVTNVGGMPEAVESAGAGLVVPSRDPSALAQAILRMKRDSAERRRCEVNARRAYEDRFSIDRMARACHQLYGL